MNSRSLWILFGRTRPRAKGHSNEINDNKQLVLLYSVVGSEATAAKLFVSTGTAMCFAISSAASQSLQQEADTAPTKEQIPARNPSSSSTDSSVAGRAGREEG